MPYTTAIPGVAQYGQAALAAKTAYQNALARINKQRSSTLRQFGYKGDINAASGVVGNLQVDPSNPYGAFQEANRSQAIRSDLGRDAMLERGLGASGGLGAQAQRTLRHDFGREDADIGTGLTESLFGLQDQQNQAAYGRDAALYQAQLDAARAAIEAERFNPANFSGLEYPEYSTPPRPSSNSGNPDPGPGPAAPITNWRQAEIVAAQVAARKKKPAKNKSGGGTHRAR